MLIFKDRSDVSRAIDKCPEHYTGAKVTLRVQKAECPLPTGHCGQFSELSRTGRIARASAAKFACRAIAIDTTVTEKSTNDQSRRT